MVTSILINGVTVSHAGNDVVDNVTLAIHEQELMAVIGPSGSGKTSLLRAIAGLETPTSGDIFFGDENVTLTSPNTRNVSMVFQDNTPMPFKTVRQNVSFPLELRGVERSEIDRRVLAETRALAIDRFLDRIPGDLAAGHQQLVQAARALVRRPSVFLLDEPLAHMDTADRRMMRTEIGALQRGYGVTMVYATNNEEEAMVLADRIAVIDQGRLRQVGPPDIIYHEPVDTFVAGFLGSPPMSIIQGDISGREVRLNAGALPLPSALPPGPVTIGVRHHDWERAAVAGLTGMVTTFENHGDHGYATVDLHGDNITMRVVPGGPTVGEDVEIWTHRFHIFDPSGRAIAHVRESGDLS